MTLDEAVHITDPRAILRARRLQYAADLLRSGRTRREASGMVKAKFGCSQQTAWRVVDMAADLVLPVAA